MADNYEIHIGGIGNSADLIVEDIISASINVSQSSMSDFSATIPKTTEVRQYLQSPVIFYNQSRDEVTWRGTLEKWSEAENSVDTKISGRGPLLGEKQTNVTETFSSTFADDALESYEANSSERFAFKAQDRDKRTTNTTPAETQSEQDGYVGDSEDFTNVGADFTVVDSDEPSNNVTYSGNHAYRLSGSTTDTFDHTFTTNKEVLDQNVTVYIRYNIAEGDSTDISVSIGGQYSDTITIDNSTGGSAAHEWAQFKVGDVGPLNDNTTYDAEFSFSNESISSFIDIDAVAVVDDSSDITVGEEQNNTYYINPSQYDSQPPYLTNKKTISSTETFVDWEVYVTYANQTTESIVGVADDSTAPDEETTVVADDTRTEFGHSALTADTAVNGPHVHVRPSPSIPEKMSESGERYGVEITQYTTFASESSQRYIISEEIDDNVLGGLQTLAEIAGYRFSPRNYNNSGLSGDERFVLFPIGYDVPEPDYRIIDATRSSDFSGYANKVRVLGDSGTGPPRAEATVQNDEEINAVGRTIDKNVKRPDLQTSEECRSVAKTILENSVQNRGESGSLTTTIPTTEADTIVGADSVVSVWGETFLDGGAEGEDHLLFAEQENIPRVEDNGNLFNDSLVEYEFLLFPEVLDVNNERYLLSTPTENDLLTLQPDGSLRFRDFGTGTDVSTASEVITSGATQTIRVRISDGTPGNVRIYVDENEVLNETIDVNTNPSGLHLGNRRRESGDEKPSRIPSGQAAHLTFDEVTRNTSTKGYDNITAGYNDTFDFVDQTESEGNQFSVLSPNNAEYREGIELDNTEGLSAPDANRYDLGTGDYNISFSFKIPSTGATSKAVVWEKGDAKAEVEGYNIYLDDGGNNLDMSISDGTSSGTESYRLLDIADDDYNEGEWTHVSININRDGDIVTYANGSEATRNDVTKFDGVDISNSKSVSVGDSGSSGVLYHLDELRAYERVLTTSEIDTISSLTDNYRDDILGGVDDFRFSADSNTTDLEADIDVRWRFNDDTTPNTAIDSEGSRDGSIFGAEYGALKAPVEEISYSFFDSAEASVKFDISGRVDTELVDLRQNVEDIKR